MDIPFDLETIPVENADKALKILSNGQSGTLPVLLGDADIFSVEWAEVVDAFEPPEDVLAAARDIDTETWFANQAPRLQNAENSSTRFSLLKGLYRVAALPFDIALLPLRLAAWPLTRQRPTLLFPLLNQPQTTNGHDDAWIEMLKSQLAQLEAAGEGTEDELDEIRQIIEDIEADGTCVFPDPVAYVTPRHSDEIAAGLVKAAEPWEVAAWLQHGTYALCAPKPVFVAHCKWMWEHFGARIITASTDHVGFQMDRPISNLETAQTVLHRFRGLGATEINAELDGSSGNSLLGARRLWVWWD